MLSNKSPIKYRILEYVTKNYSSKREFYIRAGISRGTLDNKSGITEDTLSKLFAFDKYLSPLWVLTGEGEMMKNDQPVISEHGILPKPEANLWHLMDEKNIRIKELNDRIQEQSEIIRLLLTTENKTNKINYRQFELYPK